jgi:short-subunit dehydrogenase
MSKAAMNMAVVLDHKLYASKGVKVWAFCPGFVESNLRPHTKEIREQEKKYGMLPASTSAESMTKLIEGERDADVGKFAHGSGIYQW